MKAKATGEDTKIIVGKDLNKLLALWTQIIKKMNSRSNSKRNRQNSSKYHKENSITELQKTFHVWRFETPENAAIKEVRETTMKWCKIITGKI